MTKVGILNVRFGSEVIAGVNVTEKGGYRPRLLVGLHVGFDKLG